MSRFGHGARYRWQQPEIPSIRFGRAVMFYMQLKVLWGSTCDHHQLVKRFMKGAGRAHYHNTVARTSGLWRFWGVVCARLTTSHSPCELLQFEASDA